ncbi:MAG: proline--tRNA ligase [Candidatus Nanohaloarchaeota archaeon]|nr:proline--tRNA ligase [Candidatus Nanohaloarchaeota archaeon]
MEDKRKKDLGVAVKKNEDFSEWYVQVVTRAGLADYSPVKGCMIIKPWGYAIWEKIQQYLNKKFKEKGVSNAYFPLLIPKSILEKEQEHVEGFVPEVAWVTRGGEKELEEPLAVRPTSETIMYATFSKWIRSHRDLPLKINQWANVVRWETKSTKLFLRTREFLWQEGHTVHETKEEAEVMVKEMLDTYEEMAKDLLAIAVIKGKKTDSEKFAGADYTTTIEGIMPDMKALQMGTSHMLGQNFAKAYDIKFLSRDEKEQYAWQTSWGVSTRLIGALIMVHGDDYGLVLPPAVAPVQVVIVPIWFKNNKEEVLQYAKEIESLLKDKYEVLLDDRDSHTPGYKFNEWELKGVPLRIEIGGREAESKTSVVFRRDTREKVTVSLDKLQEIIASLLTDIQHNLYQKSKQFLENSIKEVKDYEELKEIISLKKGAVKAYWCGEEECEERIKEDTGATPRIIAGKGKGKCVVCGQDATKIIIYAKAY